jgi:hypothetical protein
MPCTTHHFACACREEQVTAQAHRLDNLERAVQAALDLWEDDTGREARKRGEAMLRAALRVD